jgi:hypothetical protein
MTTLLSPTTDPGRSIVCDRCRVATDLAYPIAATAFGLCCRCGGLGTTSIEDRALLPLQVGVTAFSTSHALDRPAAIVWDVNGYYAALGVAPSASRAALGAAYRAQQGWRSVWLTMALKTLLGPQRADYDAVPLGSLYLDEALLAARRRKAHDALRGTPQPDPEALPKKPDLRLDTSLATPHDAPHETWGCWLWQTDAVHSHDIHQAWRALLSKACWDRGITTTISVGLTRASEQSWRFVDVDGALTIFVSDDIQPTPHLAAVIASHLTPSPESTYQPWPSRRSSSPGQTPSRKPPPGPASPAPSTSRSPRTSGSSSAS